MLADQCGREIDETAFVRNGKKSEFGHAARFLFRPAPPSKRRIPDIRAIRKKMSLSGSFMVATIFAERRFPNRLKAMCATLDRAIESIWRLESASPLVAATGRGAMTCV